MYSRMQNSKFYEYRARKPGGLLLQLSKLLPDDVLYCLIFVCSRGYFQSQLPYSPYSNVLMFRVYTIDENSLLSLPNRRC